jgi:hypothetical protein
VGYRFGRYLNDAVPLVVRHCDQAGEGDDELREYCLQVGREGGREQGGGWVKGGAAENKEAAQAHERL